MPFKYPACSHLYIISVWAWRNSQKVLERREWVVLLMQRASPPSPEECKRKTDGEGNWWSGVVWCCVVRSGLLGWLPVWAWGLLGSPLVSGSEVWSHSAAKPHLSLVQIALASLIRIRQKPLGKKLSADMGLLNLTVKIAIHQSCPARSHRSFIFQIIHHHLDCVPAVMESGNTSLW